MNNFEQLDQALSQFGFFAYVARSDSEERWYKGSPAGTSVFVRVNPADMHWSIQIGKYKSTPPITHGIGMEYLKDFFKMNPMFVASPGA